MKNIVLLIFLGSNVLFSQPHPLSLERAPAQLTIFGEGLISTAINERDFAISPDGKEIYFTIASPRSDFQTIVFCKQVKSGEWTKPEVVSFAGLYSDLEPAFSADGKTLYFASNRPVSGTGTKDFDIWKVKRDNNGWGTPVNLGAPINTEYDEFYPSITKAGHLYLTASYKGQGRGREDIYRAEWKENKYQTPQPLDSAVNSNLDEFNAFVGPDEDYILFTCFGKRDDAGGGDLYMSMKDASGKWLPAKCLTELNSKYLEYCPYVSPDGRKLFLTSTRYNPVKSFSNKTDYATIKNLSSQTLNNQGNIYWVDFEALRKSYMP
jgi:Tol biopolymer transport system component